MDRCFCVTSRVGVSLFISPWITPGGQKCINAIEEQLIFSALLQL